MSLLEELRALQAEAEAELAGADSAEALEAWRVRYLGAKGAVKAALQKLRDVPRADKPAAGKATNRLKGALQAAFDARKAQAGSPAATGAAVDVTLPGVRPVESRATAQRAGGPFVRLGRFHLSCPRRLRHVPLLRPELRSRVLARIIHKPGLFVSVGNGVHMASRAAT